MKFYEFKEILSKLFVRLNYHKVQANNETNKMSQHWAHSSSHKMEHIINQNYHKTSKL